MSQLTHINHIHDDTLRTRHCLVNGSAALRFHAQFTRADHEAGWRQVKAESAEGQSPESIAAAEAEVAAFARAYWVDLDAECVGSRVISEGEHYVMHELGTGAGFGGAAFEVTWLDGRAPTVCNLSGQGRVPAWMRERMPDSGRVRELR